VKILATCFILCAKLFRAKRRAAITSAAIPFYRLCELYGGKKLEYVAFRGVANMQGQWDEQSQFAESVLTRAAQQAVHLLAA
jgi:hypothetical protein